MSRLIDNPKRYSTLRLNLMEGDTLEAQEALYDSGICYYQDIVQEMKKFHTNEYPTNDLMQYFSLPYDKKREKIIKQKILSAYPTVQVEGNSLYAVLELNMVKDLTLFELHDLPSRLPININMAGEKHWNTITSKLKIQTISLYGFIILI